MSPNHKLAFTNTDSEKQDKNLCITRPQKVGITPGAGTATCICFLVHTGWLLLASPSLYYSKLHSLLLASVDQLLLGISLARNCPCVFILGEAKAVCSEQIPI